MAERWTPNTWRSKPVKQMPFYADQAKLAAAEEIVTMREKAYTRERQAAE